MIYKIPLSNIPGNLANKMFLVWVTLESRNSEPEIFKETKQWGFDASGKALEFGKLGIEGE